MNKLFKIALNIARSVAIPIFNFLIAIIGVKFLGKENWGDFIQILLWVYFVAFIANYGNKDYLIRVFSKNPSKIEAIFSSVFITRFMLLLTSLLLFLFSPFEIAILGIILSFFYFFYQSLESLIIYKQKFLLQLIAEIFGFSIIVLFIFLYNDVNTKTLLITYCIAFLIKFVIVLLGLKIDFSKLQFRFSKKQLYKLTPFFMIGLSGWLASKIDLYVATLLLDKKELASYQLLITAFLMLQAFASFIIYPFTKHIYRLNTSSILKIKNILFIVSFPLIIVSTFIIWFIFESYVHLNLNKDIYILGALSAVPIFFFLVDIIQLYKNKQEKKVMYINFITAAINLILTLILIPIYGLKGAMISIVISQFILIIIYKTKGLNKIKVI